MKKYPTYSGTQGFYAAVFPQPGLGFSSLLALIKHVTGLTLADPKETRDDISWHCTVMYSKSALTCPPTEASSVAARMTGPLMVNCRNFDYWEGHDNKGYFVAVLDAPDLHRWHEEWEFLGAVPTFDEYKAHITLTVGEDAKKIKEFLPKLIASVVARGGLPIILDNLTIYDLKDD